MDDEERKKLIERLQQEEQENFANLKPSKYTDGWTEETWEKEMEQHPLFATKLPENAELPPLVEAMQQLKYDAKANSPAELAAQYKEDGNNNFRLKKYRWAVASYTEGIKQKCADQELNAQLYCNRAAAHMRIENYGSALADAKAAVKLKPDYAKAMEKAAQCCWMLKHCEECIQWCSDMLRLKPENEEIMSLRSKAETHMRLAERDRRKAELKAKQKAKADAALRSALLERGIRLPQAQEGEEVVECDTYEALTPTHPALQDHRVHLAEDGRRLVWPAVFLYPEVMESDFVQSFDEATTFGEQMELIFGDPGSQPEWNSSGRYAPQRVSVWFKDHQTGKPVSISPKSTLGRIVLDKRFHIDNGTVSFWVLPKDTEYEKKFVEETGTKR